jgi:CheY-like chemotaxis protein
MSIEVLIVEADSSWRYVYKSQVYKANGNVTAVDNLDSALRAVKKQKYDLYITGDNYPQSLAKREESGICFKFYEELKKLHPEALVLLISDDDCGLSKKEPPLNMTFVFKRDAIKIIPAYVQALREIKARKENNAIEQA